MFPLFSYDIQPAFDPSQIHQSYCPGAKLERLGFGGKATRLLNSLAVRDVRCLLATSPKTMLPATGYSRAVLHEIRIKAERFILLANGLVEQPSLPEQAFRTFETMVDSFLGASIPDKRKVLILANRLGLEDGTKKTLAHMASRLGLTRERVRQLETESISSITGAGSLLLLQPFWVAVAEALEHAGGVGYLRLVAEVAAGRFGWEELPDVRAIGKLVALHPAFVVTLDSLVVLSNAVCVDCDVARSALQRLVQNAGEIPLTDVTPRLRATCQRLCDEEVREPCSWSEAYVSYMSMSNLRGYEGEAIRIREGMLYTAKQWDIRFESLRTAARRTLQRHGKPMHFRDVCAALAQYRAETPSEHAVHGNLSSMDDIWLWGRGIYVHRDHVCLPQSLLQSVETWVLERFEQEMPCLSVSGAYRHYRSQCREAGLPSEMALYTCLRESAHPMLAYPRPPYVYRQGKGVAHVPLYLTVEEWLEDVGEPVSHDVLKSFVCDQMGFKSFQFDQMLARLPNTVKTDEREFLHLSALAVSRQHIRGVIEYAVRLAHRQRNVSVLRLFGDKAVTCHAIGISGPRMLYSLLQHVACAELDLPRYPHIRAVAEGESAPIKGIGEQVASYLRDARRPCSYEEIEEHFVEKLGYRPASVFNVTYRDDVFRYLRGCLIHASVLGWTPRKLQALEALATRVFRESERLGMVYSTCERLLELNEHELPPLAGDLKWTRALLADLLARSEAVAVLGNTGNAYVAQLNALNIRTFEDLVHHILLQEYGGAANLDEFSEEVRRRGIVKKRFTASMLHDQQRVVIADRQVLLKELT